MLRLTDGRLVSGATIENVAFNPTIGPLQAALVGLLALGHDYAAHRIGRPGGHRRWTGPADGRRSRRSSAAIAPDAPLLETHWA